MSLATRCSACGTMFRVVQDQLRVSEGWVRCGRCDTVFNALDALVDLEAEAAALASAEPPPASSDQSFYGSSDTDQDEAEDGPHRRAAPPADDRLRQRTLEPDPSSASPSREPEWTAEEPVRHWAADPSGDRSPGFDDGPPAVAAPQADPSWRPTLEEAMPAHALPGSTPVPAPAVAPGPAPTPAFLRHADREARWASPATRAALIGSSLILAGLLALQAAYHFRDTVAASSPAADSLLRSACARWGCRIEAPRRIDQVTLEGSGLSRLPQQAAAVKLAINLRNRGSTDLMMPSIDLSLTDAQGTLIARRVLDPADFRVEPARIRRGAELPLELVLSTGERAIAGYTVELFYP